MVETRSDFPKRRGLPTKKYVPSEVMNPPKLVPLNLASSKFKVPALKKIGESTPHKPAEPQQLIKKLGESKPEVVCQ